MPRPLFVALVALAITAAAGFSWWLYADGQARAVNVARDDVVASLDVPTGWEIESVNARDDSAMCLVSVGDVRACGSVSLTYHPRGEVEPLEPEDLVSLLPSSQWSSDDERCSAKSNVSGQVGLCEASATVELGNASFEVVARFSGEVHSLGEAPENLRLRVSIEPMS